MKTYSAGKVAFIVVLMCAAFAVSSSAQTLTTIYDFCSQTDCPDGAAPGGTLVQGPDGNFYGTTSDIGFAGQGTVYKLTSSGTFTRPAQLYRSVRRRCAQVWVDPGKRRKFLRRY